MKSEEGQEFVEVKEEPPENPSLENVLEKGIAYF